MYNVWGEDFQALHTPTGNGTITPDDQKDPLRVLDAIQTKMKEEEHFGITQTKSY